jgi:hypothetical protein
MHLRSDLPAVDPCAFDGERHPDTLVEVIADMRRSSGIPYSYDPHDGWLPFKWGLDGAVQANITLLQQAFGRLLHQYVTSEPQTVAFLEDGFSPATVISALNALALPVELAAGERNSNDYLHRVRASAQTPRGIDLLLEMKTVELEDAWLSLAFASRADEFRDKQAGKDRLLHACRPDFAALPDYSLLKPALALHSIVIDMLKSNWLPRVIYQS